MSAARDAAGRDAKSRRAGLASSAVGPRPPGPGPGWGSASHGVGRGIAVGHSSHGQSHHARHVTAVNGGHVGHAVASPSRRHGSSRGVTVPVRPSPAERPSRVRVVRLRAAAELPSPTRPAERPVLWRGRTASRCSPHCGPSLRPNRLPESRTPSHLACCWECCPPPSPPPSPSLALVAASRDGQESKFADSDCSLPRTRRGAHITSQD